MLGTLGDVGRYFYFILQGSVAIKINNKVIKVRCLLRLFPVRMINRVDESILTNNRQILGDKTSFGEIAMQCNVKRSASVGVFGNVRFR